MRQSPNRTVKALSVLAVFWATAGMMIDVLAGPLPPVMGIEAAYALVFPDAPATGRSLPPPPEDHDSSSEDVPLSLCEAVWPVPFLAASPRPEETREPTFHGWTRRASLPLVSRAHEGRCDAPLPSSADLSLQLCRLLC